MGVGGTRLDDWGWDGLREVKMGWKITRIRSSMVCAVANRR